jgi:hypothetical protein
MAMALIPVVFSAGPKIVVGMLSAAVLTKWP